MGEEFDSSGNHHTQPMTAITDLQLKRRDDVSGLGWGRGVPVGAAVEPWQLKPGVGGAVMARLNAVPFQDRFKLSHYPTFRSLPWLRLLW
jgi:hypothetical protein